MIRPGNAPINSRIHVDAPPRLLEIWTQWFTNIASLFAKNGMITTVAIGASPAVYQNTNSYLEQVLVQGGTVSSVQFSRDGTTYFQVASSTNVAVLLSGSDFLKVTYTVAPTLKVVPL